MKLQRDIFLDEVNKKLETDKDIYVMSADFGAASLDITRDKFKENFIHCGISEQAMFDIGTGLALEKKKIITYAMGPFISLRALEQIKCGPAMMNLPMTILSVGIGLGYADAGPTHYATEDYACLRAIGGTTIYTASDNIISKTIAENVIDNDDLNYVRLDRHPTEDINFEQNEFNFQEGFRILGKYSENKNVIISHGRILHNCVKTAKELNDDFYLVDLFRSKPISKKLIELLRKTKKIVVVDEQTQYGNLSSAVQSELSKYDLYPILKNISLPDEYVFENGGRDFLLKKYNLDETSILNFCKKFS
jgi:transketolase|tara:strand:+ start:1820 stop:2740 length:921 start_codon:yes stop_codon:yes gene_type:complete